MVKAEYKENIAPRLFRDISKGLSFKLTKFGIAHTKAELCLLRERALCELRSEGINTDNYSIHEDHFKRVGAEFRVMNEF